jgi:phospholipase/carboxylesterase
MVAKELSLYHLIRPAVVDTGAPAGIFLLHGYGSNEEDLFSFAAELPKDLFVISIRAPYSLEPFGYAWYAINFEAARGKWNDTEQAIASRDALERFIDEAVTAYGIDPKRINLLGFSQGTILCYALALSEPERFKALVALSGYIDSSMLREGYRDKDHSKLAIYASHGQLDMVIPPEWAGQSSAFLKDLGIDHRFEEFPVGHGVSPANFASFRKWLEGKY